MAVAAGVDTWEIVVDITFNENEPRDPQIAEYVGTELTYEVLKDHGSGGGWPEVAVRGERDDVISFATKHYEGDDLEWITDQLSLVV